jgi:predicted nuclease of predicted toxin-antitoxin system
MNILIDMNLPPRWVQVFAEAGLNAVHWSHIGAPTASDGEIMTWARLRILPLKRRI